MAQLSADAKPLAQHLFTASWQQKQFSAISKHPPKDAVVQVLDIAENYTCQYQREIQSVHWHHTTVTLHPIVCYYQCADCEEGVVCETLAFISDDKVHDFHAVQTFVCLAMEHRDKVHDFHTVQTCVCLAMEHLRQGPRLPHCPDMRLSCHGASETRSTTSTLSRHASVLPWSI